MEIITGRLTADAEVKELQNDKKVTNFRLAINYRYRRNGETVEDTTFVDCAYWLNSGVAKFLTKGTQVQLYGRLGVNAWISGNNEPKAIITFHVNDLTLLGKIGNAGTEKGGKPAKKTKAVDTDVTGSDDDDLPF
jgi:single-strand DNA-binding protein